MPSIELGITIAFHLSMQYHFEAGKPPKTNPGFMFQGFISQMALPAWAGTILIAGVLVFSGCATPEVVVEPREAREKPNKLTEEDYRHAASFLSWNLSNYIYRTNVSPNWIDEDRFWYRVDIPEGQKFYRVDAQARDRQPAFDHQRLAGALSEAAEEEFTAYELPFRSFDLVDSEFDAISFHLNEMIWQCDLELYECDEIKSPPKSIANSIDSPDGRYAAFIRDYNLWVYDREEEEEVQLTDDGEAYYGYATNSQGWTRSDNPILLWSPDSRRIATFQQDERGVGKMPLIRTQTGRPGFELWPYALPGDSVVPKLERVVIDVKEIETIRLDVEPSHQRTSNCCGLTRGQNWADVEWSDDGNHLAFVSTSRDYSTVTLYTADPESGDVRQIYTETDEPFFESHLGSRGVPNWRVFHDTGEFLWFTRNDNWGHLYLHDLETGELKNRITVGEWNVIDILRIDLDKRELLITGVGREEGRDPYFSHLYRVSMDGGEPELLTAEDGNHQVSVSPGGEWIVTNWSRPDQQPASLLKNSSGDNLMELEHADIEELMEMGYRPPEPFRVKARDGITDIYGLLYKPSDFDPEKRYPIINSIYPGPQTGSVGTRSFTVFRRGQAHALAELGFIVVQVDAFGTPFRSKEFHTNWYGDMADNGLPDQVAAMQQLSERYDWIDLDRAGMFGHSGGGFATAAAMFQYPDFFKVGVSSAGNHDNRGYTYYWGEKYQGPLEELTEGDSYTNQANHLKADQLDGKLLISYGTMDSNVHPNMTLQVINELIAHNKDFDLMVYPNRGHGYANEAYNMRITWDYFVRHLLGKNPPVEFEF